MQKHSAVFIFALVAVLAVSAEARRGTGTRTQTATATDAPTDPAVTAAPFDPVALANLIIGVLTNFVQDLLVAFANCAAICGLTGTPIDIAGCLNCFNMNFPNVTIPSFP